MRILVEPRRRGVPLDLGRPCLPGSKSHTQRAMLLAAFLPGDRVLAGALRSRDTEVLAAALRRCGARCRWTRHGLQVRGRARRALLDVDLHVEENGTALRTLLLLVPLLGGRLRIDGSAGLRRRPIAPALQALARAGVGVAGRRLPVVVDGRRTTVAAITVAADITSQAATGALLAAALRPVGERTRNAVLVRIVRPAAPDYLQLTIALLRQFGFVVRARTVGRDLHCRVGPGRAPPRRIHIPPDPSARTFALALAALHGRDARELLPRVPGDPHPEWQSDDDCARLRAAGTARLLLRDLHAR
ncbi:MAG TPA: hypothetical protein VK348_12955, partial [Planctomycetota bacterium]|nr:hypothetical protein [Planctomycetota bacterium]